MTSGEALADSIIIKKKSQSSFSGVRAAVFSETMELSNFFFFSLPWMRAACSSCGKLWQVSRSNYRSDSHQLKIPSPLYLGCNCYPNSAATATTARYLTLLNMADYGKINGCFVCQNRGLAVSVRVWLCVPAHYACAWTRNKNFNILNYMHQKGSYTAAAREIFIVKCCLFDNLGRGFVASPMTRIIKNSIDRFVITEGVTRIHAFKEITWSPIKKHCP